MFRRSSFIVLLCLLPFLSAVAQRSAPNIILITLDTTRADRMGFLGSKAGLTPNLDELAKQSVVFTRAYAQVPLTTPFIAGSQVSSATQVWSGERAMS
jgi:phosphoglycerol transferase MdoB-like AlkP superfamily enzyme